jgi:hypothetical protein
MKKRGAKTESRVGPPSVRLPLPKKKESRHGDQSKYDRRKEKERLRKELENREKV